MCLIIDRPAGLPIPSDWIDHASRTNPDGWGVMHSDGRRLHCRKDIDPRSLPDYLKAIGPVALTVHLRYATHGKVDTKNCHPFPIVGGRYALMHNGVIDTVPILREDRSDTWHFAHYVLEPILKARPEWFGAPELTAVLLGLIGDGNKLVIRRSDGARMIVGESAGSWKDGLWLSNTYSINPPRPAVSLSSSSTSAQTHLGRDSWSPWESDDTRLFGSADAPLIRPRTGLDFTLADLAECSHADIVDICSEDPDYVAGLIREHFEQ